MSEILNVLKSYFNGSKEPIPIRGHHLIRLADYLREGDILQGSNYGYLCNSYERRVLKKIVKNPRQPIQIIDSLDYLCKYCKTKKEECSLNASIDHTYAQMAGLETGKIYPAETVLKALKENKDFKIFMLFRNALIFAEIWPIENSNPPSLSNQTASPSPPLLLSSPPA